MPAVPLPASAPPPAVPLGPALVPCGALIRLNGVEVYRINLSEGTVGDQSHAAAVVGDWFPGRVSETMIPGDALRVGDNVLAVEVHQYSRVSTDLRLELELSAPRF